MKRETTFLLILSAMAILVLCAGCSSSPAPPTTTPPTTMTTTVPTTMPPVTTTAMVTTPPATTIPSGGGTAQITLTAQNIAFDKSTLTVPAGATVVITFVNMDAGIPHNFALYTDSHATQKIFAGSFVTGPATVTYTFKAPATPGTYYFRCDVHPTVMYGDFVVT